MDAIRKAKGSLGGHHGAANSTGSTRQASQYERGEQRNNSRLLLVWTEVFADIGSSTQKASAEIGEIKMPK